MTITIKKNNSDKIIVGSAAPKSEENFNHESLPS